MKSKSYIAILISSILSLNGCAEIALLDPNTKLVNLKHSKNFRELQEKDCNMGVNEFNCIRYDSKRCFIVIYRPTEVIQILPMIPKDQWSKVLPLQGKQKQEFLDRYYMLSLGHELRHCFEGQWHEGGAR